MTSVAESFFVAGGSLTNDAPSYVVRKADADLLQTIRQGRLCYVLDARQVGKSSLMVRAARALRGDGDSVVILDMSTCGQHLSIEQWYYGLLTTIGEHLGIEDQLEEFWLENHAYGPCRRLFAALRNVVLAANARRLVIFIDEIDAVQSLAFSVDEFFAAIRGCYNNRSHNSELNRLQFCLLGVATPGELIADPRVTPFNIGSRIELSDFSQDEAAPLLLGLPNRDPNLLARVHYWTNGHPYLTQKLCTALSESNATSQADVDRICSAVFLCRNIRFEEDNLALVRRRLLSVPDTIADLLNLYRRIHEGQRAVAYDAGSISLQALILSGIVTVDASQRHSRVVVRNRIYKTIFDADWVRDSMPDSEVRRQRRAWRVGIARASVIWVLAAVSTGAAIWQTSRAHGAERLADAIGNRTSTQKRLLDQLQVETLKLQASLNTGKQELDSQRRMARDANRERDVFLRDKRELAGSLAATDRKLFQANHLMRQAVERRDSALDETSRAIEERNSRYVSALAQQSGSETEAVRISMKAVESVIRSGRQPSQSTQQALFEAVSANVHLVRRLFHRGRLNTVSFSGDDKYLILAGDGRCVDVYSTQDWRLVRELAVIPSNVTGGSVSLARFAFNGSRFVTAYHDLNNDSVFQVWDIASVANQDMTPIRTLRCQQTDKPTASLSSDGALLATNGPGYTARVWNIELGTFTVLKGHTGYVNSVSFSSDYKPYDHFVVTVGDSNHQNADQTVRVWDVRTGACVQTIGPELAPVRRHAVAAGFSHFTDLVYVGTGEGGLSAYMGPGGNTSDLNKAYRDFGGSVGKINDIEVSADSFWLGTVTVRGEAQVWYSKLATQPLYHISMQTYNSKSLQFSRHQQRIVVGSSAGYADIWSIRQATYTGCQGTVFYVDSSRSGTDFISASNEEAVHIWERHSVRFDRVTSTWQAYNDPVHTITWPKHLIQHVVFSPDGKRIAMAAADGSVQIWTGKMHDCNDVGTSIPLIGHKQRVWSIFFSKNGDSVVTASQDGTARVWDARSGVQTAVIPPQAGKQGYQSAVFQSDSPHILVAAQNRTAGIYDLKTKKWVQDYRVPGERGGVNEFPSSAVFSPDEKSVLTADGDGNAYLFNTRSGAILGAFHTNGDPLFSAMFSPDGKRVVTTGADGATRIWRLPVINGPTPFHEHEPELMIKGNGLRMNIARFTPDGKFIMVAGEDQLVQFYPATLDEMRKQARGILNEAGIYPQHILQTQH